MSKNYLTQKLKLLSKTPRYYLYNSLIFATHVNILGQDEKLSSKTVFVFAVQLCFLKKNSSNYFFIYILLDLFNVT